MREGGAFADLGVRMDTIAAAAAGLLGAPFFLLGSEQFVRSHFDSAGIRGHPLAAHQASFESRGNRGLHQMAQEFVLSKLPVPVHWDDRVIRGMSVRRSRQNACAPSPGGRPRNAAARTGWRHRFQSPGFHRNPVSWTGGCSASSHPRLQQAGTSAAKTPGSAQRGSW